MVNILDLGKNELKNKIIERLPIFEKIDFEILDIKPGYFRIKVYHSKNIERFDGIFFGGAIAMIFDMVLGITVLTVNDKSNQVTVSLNIEFLRKAKSDYYIFEGKIIKKGKNIVFVDGVMYSDNKESARAHGIWYIFE